MRRGIIKVGLFDPLRGGAANGPDVLLVGFLAALCSSTAWLIIATYFGLPVSTTHSIVGSLVGVGMAYGGPAAVIWLNPSKKGLGRLKNSMVGVVASWVVSPLLSAFFAVIIFLMVRTLVLRRANPFKNGLLFLPFFYAVTVAITIFFIIYKGSPQLQLDKKFSVTQAVGIALGGGGIMAVLSWWFFIPQAKRFVERWEAETLAAAGVTKGGCAVDSSDDMGTGADLAGATIKGEGGGMAAGLGKMGFHVNIAEEQAALQDDEDVRAMHDRVEKFDPKAERLFMWLQIFTAAFDSFAHGTLWGGGRGGGKVDTVVVVSEVCVVVVCCGGEANVPDVVWLRRVLVSLTLCVRASLLLPVRFFACAVDLWTTALADARGIPPLPTDRRQRCRKQHRSIFIHLPALSPPRAAVHVYERRL